MGRAETGWNSENSYSQELDLLDIVVAPSLALEYSGNPQTIVQDGNQFGFLKILRAGCPHHLSD